MRTLTFPPVLPEHIHLWDSIVPLFKSLFSGARMIPHCYFYSISQLLDVMSLLRWLATDAPLILSYLLQAHDLNAQTPPLRTVFKSMEPLGSGGWLMKVSH